jgi:release factor glutamine methyltransferase
MSQTLKQAHEEPAFTVLEIIRRTSEFFRTKDIDSPRLTIELMLCEVLGCNRVGLYLHHDKPLQNGELELLRSMVKRRGKREPLQYVLGSTEFYGMTFKVSPGVLIPRPETELLVDLAKKYIENSGNTALQILDVGTGSGCIAIALAKCFPAAKVTAIDVSAQALEIAKKNAALNEALNIIFAETDIISGWVGTDKFDVIVSNPPYISVSDSKSLQLEVGLFEPLPALTDNADGLTFYRRFAALFPAILSETGRFFVEIGFGQAEAVGAIFSTAGFAVEFYNDYAGIPRIAAGSRSQQGEL